MLPKIEQPLFKITIPSTKQDVMVRPMLVKEEKILLMAKEGNDYGEMLRAIKQVVNNCLMDTDISKLAIFDIEYLFLKLRSISIESTVKISYVDEDDSVERDFEIDLDKVVIDFSNKKEPIIKIDKSKSLVLRYPSSALYDDNIGDKESDIMDALVADCIVSYSDGDKKYMFADEPKDEIKDFVDNNISAKVYKQIQEFLNNVPSLKYEIKYKDNSGKEKTVTLKSLNDFFTF